MQKSDFQFAPFALLLFVLATLSSFGQNNIDRKITVKHDGTLSETLETITRQTGLLFSYNPRKIDPKKNISINITEKSLAEVLNEIIRQTGLEYSLVENQIVLSPGRQAEKSNSSVTTWSGYIRDENSGEALIGATVVVHELKTGVAANAFGFFSLTIPKGTYTISVSFVGYRPLTKTLTLNVPIQEEVRLSEVPPVLNEVVVTTKENADEDPTVGKIELKPKAVAEKPSLFGELDVIKSLESVPGVKLHSDGSTFYSVRGGSRDQNLILLDDAPIYNPSHLLGIFSTIIPDAVSDIHIYKGDMPASFGGRLSSILDIRTRKGNDQHFQSWGSYGLISSKLGIEGPIKKDKSSFLLSYRGSHIKWFFDLLSSDVRKFQFHDFTGKTNFKLNAKNRVYFSFYSGSDNFFNTNSGIQWANNAGTFRWNHLFHEKLFLNTTLAASGYDYFLYTDVAQNTRWISHISTLNLKTDFTYFVKPQNEITFGLALNGYNFNPGNIKSNNSAVREPVTSVRNSGETVLYGNHELRIGDRWGVRYGLRLTSWNNSGEAFEILFNSQRAPADTLYFKKGQRYKNFLNAEPRFSVSYSLGSGSTLSIGYARTVQNVHLISNSISPFTSLEVWLPSSYNIRPQIANQLTIGFHKKVNQNGIVLTAEGYYKKMQHQMDFAAHASTLLNPLFESELRFGTGTAYGAELLAKKDEGRLRGWVGYSYGRSKRKFEDLNNGKPFNTFFDRPHQVNLVTTYDISTRWNVGLYWNFSSGSPFSSPQAFYQYNGQEIPVYGQKNNDRLPNYHRLDLSATVKLNKNSNRKFQHSLAFSLYNIYGRKNPLFINYNKAEIKEGDFKIPVNLLEHERVTSQFYLFRFTPSFTYNFKWR